MQQVFLSGAGQVAVLDAPPPARVAGAILVRNACSLISAGTEGAAVTRNAGVRGLVEKATASKGRIEQVWSLARTQGLASTVEMVRGRLQDMTPIGYSCAGTVLEVDHLGLGFKPGDRVAGMGTGFANHAEFVTLPKNLAVKIPDKVSEADAAFAGIACIALQGVRRLELSMGERVGVIGLGLIGQLTTRFLAAMGCEAFGIDLVKARAELAQKTAGVRAWAMDDTESIRYVREITGGMGLDAVIITAASSSSGPVNLAFDLCRQRGRVSIVGDVGLDLERAKMYRKELEVRLSCSYGPGRYDDDYELHGHDYNPAHVRWTERRNLEYYLSLLDSGRMQVHDLISHNYPVTDATAAYAQIKSGGSATFGVMLEYPPSDGAVSWIKPQTAQLTAPMNSAPSVSGPTVGRDRPIRLALIGAGGFAKAVHVPNLTQLSRDFTLAAVVGRTAGSIAALGSKLNVKRVTTDVEEVLADSSIDAVLIATRHASHAALAERALKAGKHVFVEKPLSIDIESGQRIVELSKSSGLVVRVGFNRRFSPWLGAMRAAIGSKGRRILLVRSNVGDMAGHWSNTIEEGGRILGEGVHFFDVANWFFDAEPMSVTASFIGDGGDVRESDLSCTIQYPDGGVAQLTYTTLGPASWGKESYEAFGNGQAALSRDFSLFEATRGKGPSRSARGDKGQRGELEEFAAAIRGQQFDVKGADARAGLVATWMAAAVRRSAVEKIVMGLDI